MRRPFSRAHRSVSWAVARSLMRLQHADGARAPAAVETLEPDGDSAGARSARNDRDCLDDAVAGLADAGLAHAEGRAHDGRTSGGPSTGADARTREQGAVRHRRSPIGRPCSSSSGAGQNLDDAACEVLDEGAGVGQISRGGGLIVKKFFVRDARERGAAARWDGDGCRESRAADRGTVCGGEASGVMAYCGVGHGRLLNSPRSCAVGHSASSSPDGRPSCSPLRVDLLNQKFPHS